MTHFHEFWSDCTYSFHFVLVPARMSSECTLSLSTELHYINVSASLWSLEERKVHHSHFKGRHGPL